MRAWQFEHLAWRARAHPDEADDVYRTLYFHGMEVGEISGACRVDEWVVRRAILGDAWGRE